MTSRTVETLELPPGAPVFRFRGASIPAKLTLHINIKQERIRQEHLRANRPSDYAAASTEGKS